MFFVALKKNAVGTDVEHFLDCIFSAERTNTYVNVLFVPERGFN